MRHLDKLVEYINEKTNHSFENVKVSSVVFNKDYNEVTFKFIYKPNRNTITAKERAQLKELVQDFLKMQVKVDVKTKKALVDEDVIRDFVFKFITSEYSSIADGFLKQNILVGLKEDLIVLKVSFLDTFYEFVKNKGFEKELEEFLEQNFFENFEITLLSTNADKKESSIEKRKELVASMIVDETSTIQFAKIEDLTPFIGEPVTEEAVLPGSVKVPNKNMAVAGSVRFITKRSFTSKRKDENGEYKQKDYFSFSIVNGNDNLACVIFPKESDIEKFETLQQNDQVIAFGDAEKFNERLNFKVKRLSLCSVEQPEEEMVPLKEENNHYIFVKPEPYIMLEQPSLFDGEKQVNDFLKNNTVVVFDLETTGLEATVNEIIEIGAVKIENGKITETFSCLVKPKQEISQEITDITGITNEMVANSYSIEQVLQDFYKFTRGCVLSAYNIAFDYNFLYVSGKKQGYEFNNRQIDSMYLARTKLHGIKNFKLKTVATALGVSLENAHRAVHDAIATAEVFILLSDDLK